MKIPINWLNEFVKVPTETKSLTDALTMAGHMLDKKLVIDGKTVIDVELRGNRADCYSIYGIAREVGALFDKKIKTPAVVPLTKVDKLDVNLEIKTPLVKRATITKIKNVKIVKSPAWLSDRLEMYGMESVNNIVDLTNYVMIETGEPMHAFDLDKIGTSLEIRLARDGEKITTFQNSQITLTKDDLVWAKGSEILSVAGAIGEKFHSISDSTKNVLLEAANYDRANIRRSVYRHNLLTEAGLRHEKDLDPNMVDGAIGRFLYFVKKYGWGEIDAKIYDYYPKEVSPWKIKLSLEHLSALGGIEIPKSEVINILKNLNFRVLAQSKNILEILVPTYRTDVTLEEDLVEEVLRIYGYDKIPTPVLSLEIPDNITPDYILQEGRLRESATSVGFNEAITSAFVKEDLSKFNVHGTKVEGKTINLYNPPSPDIKSMRLTLLPNLYELAEKAIYERVTELRLFEMGKIYYREKNKYSEQRTIGFTFYQDSKNAFRTFKGLLVAFFEKSGIAAPDFVSAGLLASLSNSYNLVIRNKVIGFGGRINNIYFAEIDLESVLGEGNEYNVSLWPKYPPQIEDITLIFPEKTHIGEVAKIIESDPHVRGYDLTGTYKGSYTFRIWYQDPRKTLTNEEVGTIRKEILTKIKTKFGGTVKE